MRMLSEALPEISDERELRHIAKKAFGAHFRTILDLILLERHQDTIIKRIVIDESVMEKRDRAKAEGTCVVCFAPHLGAVGAEAALFALLGRPYTPHGHATTRNAHPALLLRHNRDRREVGLRPRGSRRLGWQ